MTTPTGTGPEQPARTPIVSWEAPAEEVGPAPGVKFASHGVRFLAYIIDALVISAAMILLIIVISAIIAAGAGTSDLQTPPMTAAAAGALIVGTLLIFVLAIAYFPFFWARGGQTPGMRPFGLFIVRDVDGGRISTGQAIVRLIGMWVSAIAIYIGFVWILIDSRHRGWHDLMAGTVMVERVTP